MLSIKSHKMETSKKKKILQIMIPGLVSTTAGEISSAPEWENVVGAERRDPCGWNVATRTHINTQRWCIPLRQSCGWRKSSPCEPPCFLCTSYGRADLPQHCQNTSAAVALMTSTLRLSQHSPGDTPQACCFSPTPSGLLSLPGSQHSGEGSLTQYSHPSV